MQGMQNTLIDCTYTEQRTLWWLWQHSEKVLMPKIIRIWIQQNCVQWHMWAMIFALHVFPHHFLCCRRSKTWYEFLYGNPWLWLSGLCASESCFEVADWNVSFQVPRSCDPDDLVAVWCWLNSVMKNVWDFLNVLWMELHYYSCCMLLPWPELWTAASSAITDIKMQKGWEHLLHGYVWKEIFSLVCRV